MIQQASFIIHYSLFKFVIYFIVFFVLLLFGFAKTTQAAVPVWIVGFDKCTDFQITNEQFTVDLHTFLTTEKQLAERRAQMRDIQKAREDVNKLVATVYNELRTQQIVLNYGELRDVLHSLGIVVVDKDRETNELKSGDEICKAAYQVKVEIDGKQQCVAVAQEARFVTNADDYIYEESRRRAMDMLFCYLGDWRHFPIADINDTWNCEQLGLDSSCSIQEIWQKLGEEVFHDPDQYDDMDGNQSPIEINDDQHVHNLCEGMRGIGKKCAQDALRDYVKYSTVDKITRKDRTVVLAPPQTWYTPQRCRIITSFLPASDEAPEPPRHKTPYTKNIKSLDIVDDPDKLNSTEALNFWFGSKFGNPTLTKPPSNMDFNVEYSVEKELQAINIPENSFTGLAAKTEQLATKIIQEMTDLRKIQYTSGEGLREATLRIGWRDYEWDKNNFFLDKYAALDQPVFDRKKPNKIFRPLNCYWKGDPRNYCENETAYPAANDTGAYFYFDTGLVIAPIAITKDKIQSAIQAQFDLAQKAFDDRPKETPESPFGSCDAEGGLTLTLETFLPAPWEDTSVNLAQATNPLTGKPYIPDSFRIPNLPDNYFNVIYNDVFQLYHTPLPDVLAGWFRVNEPGYDSIYTTSEPISLEDIIDDLGPTGKGPHEPPPPAGPTGPLGKGCDKYNFAGRGIDACFLKAIAMAESSCDPNAGSSAGACGLMQLMPETATKYAGRTVTCQELKSNPELSIQLSVAYFKDLSGTLARYRSKGFDIGNQFTQSGSTVTYGGNTYDRGNDDIIAAYNAGEGDKCVTPKGTKQGFCPSSDCQNPPTPAWQCNITPGGYAATQTYVQRVQDYQNQCGKSTPV